MAIIIPSNKIYHSENEKLNKNKIDRIDVNVRRIAFESQEQGQIATMQATPTVEVLPTTATVNALTSFSASDYEGKFYAVTNPLYSSYFVFALNKTYYQTVSISFAKSSVQNLVSVDGKIYANISVSYNVKHPTAKVTLTRPTNNTNSNPSYGLTQFDLVPDTSASGTPTTEKIQTTITKKYSNPDWILDNDVEVSQGSGDERVELTANGDNYIATAYILCGAVQGTCEYSHHQPLTATGYQYQMYKEFECTQYVPQTITISVEGKLTRFNTEDITVTVGEPYSKNSLQIQGNEFLQEKNSWGIPNDNTLATQKLYENVLNKHIHGKETATLKCSFGDYFDEDGNSVLGFSKTDTVKPIDLFSQYEKATTIDGVYWEKSSSGNKIIATNSGGTSSSYTLYETNTPTDKPFKLHMELEGSRTIAASSNNAAEVYVYWYDKNGEIKNNLALWVVSDTEKDTLTIDDCYGIQKIVLYVNRNIATASFTFSNVTSTSTKVQRGYFEVGDIVIPQKYAVTSEGLKDVPMSMRNVENLETPKSFEVVGVNFIYDGASWQELILEERN